MSKARNLRPSRIKSFVIVAIAAAGALGLVACGSGTSSPTATAPVAAPAVGEDAGGSVGASAVVKAGASCQFVEPPYQEGRTYTFVFSGSSFFFTNGKETVQCRGTVNPAPPRNEFYSGFACFVPQTNDWPSNSQLALRPNGTVSLTCRAR